jgi:hypothetical protein
MGKKFEIRDKYNLKSLLFKVLNAVLWNVGIFLEKIINFEGWWLFFEVLVNVGKRPLMNLS